MRTIKPVLLWTENLIHHSGQKHIDIANHAVRDWVNEWHVTVRCVKSGEQLADMLTKAPPKDVHRWMMHGRTQTASWGGGGK